ncbi:MAG TPA: hypothetical protein VMW56_14505 [Candidatus Margulisiibacteriota bacterium]|nr:hypothetical protein [Candidatus Margulisiibacteriota bacterium]
MSKRSFAAGSWTATATNDTTNIADNTHQTLDPGSASQICKVGEIYMGGQAAASTVNNMVFARNSTVLASGTALSSPNTDGPVNNFAAAVTTVPAAFVAATTKPQRSSVATLSRLNLCYNAFGGIVRWVPAPDYEWYIIGQGTSIQTSLSAVSAGGGVQSSHIGYELM